MFTLEESESGLVLVEGSKQLVEEILCFSDLLFNEKMFYLFSVSMDVDVCFASGDCPVGRRKKHL